MFQRNTAFHALWHPTYIVYILFNPVNTFFYNFTCVKACQWIKELWPAHLISIAVKLFIKLLIPGKKGTFWSLQFTLHLLNIMGGYQCFYLVTGGGG